MSIRFVVHNGQQWTAATRRKWNGAAWVTAGNAAPATPAGNGLPYPFPTAAPWNVPQPMIVPTPDGYGQTVHPDVIDFGASGWRGHRYWMGITPFRGGDPRTENPCILVSEDGYNWAPPAGLTNPLESGPGPTYHANSDTDLTYDPVGDRLILLWRLYHTGLRTEQIRMAHSTDGVVWSTPVVAMASNGSADLGNNGGVQQITSPSMVRVSATDWRMFTINADINNDPTKSDRMFTANNPYGPWGNPQPMIYGGTGLTNNAYHADVILGPDGRFWMVGQHNNSMFPAVSADGINWTSGAKFLIGRAGQWDQNQYRACITPSPDGLNMDMWYSAFNTYGTDPTAYSNQVWQTGYTRVPRSIWTSL